MKIKLKFNIDWLLWMSMYLQLSLAVYATIQVFFMGEPALGTLVAAAVYFGIGLTNWFAICHSRAIDQHYALARDLSASNLECYLSNNVSGDDKMSKISEKVREVSVMDHTRQLLLFKNPWKIYSID